MQCDTVSPRNVHVLKIPRPAMHASHIVRRHLYKLYLPSRNDYIVIMHHISHGNMERVVTRAPRTGPDMGYGAARRGMHDSIDATLELDSYVLDSRPCARMHQTYLHEAKVATITWRCASLALPHARPTNVLARLPCPQADDS